MDIYPLKVHGLSIYNTKIGQTHLDQSMQLIEFDKISPNHGYMFPAKYTSLRGTLSIDSKFSFETIKESSTFDIKRSSLRAN